MFSQEYMFFINSKLVADLRGEFVFIGEVDNSITDIFAVDQDDKTLFYFVGEDKNVQKGFLSKHPHIHDNIIL